MAIVGGGLVGALAAVLLGGQGRRVVLMERTQPQTQSGELGIDLRNVAVSPASQRLLDAAGIWSQLNAASYDRMWVIEERGTRHLDISAAEVDRAELGWICEHSQIVCALWRVLATMDSVELRVGAEVEAVTPHPDYISVALASGEVTARLLIGADGHRSSVRAALAVPVSEKPTGHHALATVIRTQHGHGGVAWQKFLVDGPLAVLPSCQPHLASVVWSQTAAQAERRAQQPPEAFCAELTQHTEQRFGRVEAVDRRLVFPVSQMLVQSFNPEPRALLIGDAARAIHPLAGLGANVGFEDVGDLVAVAGELAADQDLGASGLWENFARQRRARAQMMLALMTGLRRIYAAPDPLTGWLRNLGVDWFDHSGRLKQQFVREAMGEGSLGEGVGALAQGPLALGIGALAQRVGPLAQNLGRFVRQR